MLYIINLKKETDPTGHPRNVKIQIVTIYLLIFALLLSCSFLYLSWAVVEFSKLIVYMLANIENPWTHSRPSEILQSNEINQLWCDSNLGNIAQCFSQVLSQNVELNGGQFFRNLSRNSQILHNMFQDHCNPLRDGIMAWHFWKCIQQAAMCTYYLSSLHTHTCLFEECIMELMF